MVALPKRASSGPILLELDLTRGLLESPPSSPLAAMQQRGIPVLRNVVEALHTAADDDDVVGLVTHVGRVDPTLAQASELRAAVRRFRQRGKRTVCWAETYGELGPGNVGYHLATAFEQVWLQPSGDVGLTGVVAHAVFVKEALDKLGVTSEIGQRKEYKTAANTFVQSSMTGPHREMAERLVASVMDTIVTDVAEARGLDAAAVREAVDHAPLQPADAKQRGLVDEVGYRDEVYTALRRELGDVHVRYVDRYARSVALHDALRGKAVRRRNKPVVAVVTARGPIHLGRSGGRGPVASTSIGSDTLGAALRTIGEDADVEAVVLRIDSPGGSYVASDTIRQEVLSLKRTGRPVVASMATVAGSGGYYIAMPADVVVASPGTLTGSIGVLGGKQVLREALGKIGIGHESVSEGRYADMFSTQRRFTDDEWQRLDDTLDRIYADFTEKAARDRNLSLDELETVARGRVWTGADARDRGLVDELGGLETAIDIATRRAGRTREEVEVRMLPKLNLLERVRPPENSDRPVTAGMLAGPPLLEQLLGRLGLPAYGALTMPVVWRFS